MSEQNPNKIYHGLDGDPDFDFEDYDDGYGFDDDDDFEDYDDTDDYGDVDLSLFNGS
jgi:hypothetical protein